MLNFLKIVGWVFAWPFVGFWLLIEFHSCNVAGKRYKKDPNSSTQDERYEKVRKLVSHFLYWKRITVRNVGKEKLENKVMLFVANHKSNVDPLVVLKSVLSQNVPYITFVAKKELQGTKVGNIADLLDVIYVDRQNIREVPKVIDEMVKTLQKKTSVCLFAEGTRIAGDEFGEFKPTLLEAAYKTHLSIQPLVLYNTDEMLTKKYKKNRVVDTSYLSSINSSKFINVERNIFCKKLQTSMFDEYLKLKKNSTKK